MSDDALPALRAFTEESGLTVTEERLPLLAAEVADLRARANRLRQVIRPEDEPGPLDLRPRG